MERVGAPLFPKFSVLAGTGKETEAGQSGVFPGQCYQVTSQGAGAGEAG